MLLLPETVSRQDGTGPGIETGNPGEPLTLTLEITAAQEQQGLEVAVYGSPDGEQWTSAPVARFPWHSYVGRYTLPLDLRPMPQVKHLKAVWKMRKWTSGAPEPFFSFHVAVV